MARPVAPLFVDPLLSGLDASPSPGRHRSDSLTTLPLPQPSDAAAKTAQAAGLGVAADTDWSPLSEALSDSGGLETLPDRVIVAAALVARVAQPQAAQAGVAGPAGRPDPVVPSGAASLSSLRGQTSGQAGPHDDQAERFDDDCHLREAILVAGSDQTSTVALMDLSWTFQLHSSPTSSKVIYLD